MALPDGQPEDDPPVLSRRARRDPSAWRKTWEGAKEALFILILLSVLSALGVVVFRVITADTSLQLIPITSESAAVIRANERVVQLTQWTISTILIVAGGLIGLNWYQNQRRYERDKEELDTFREATSDEVSALRSSVAVRLQRLERQSEALAEQHRDHVLVQAVDEVTRALTVYPAFRAIMSWYDRLREIDDASQERALTLVWQGWESIYALINNGLPPEFYYSVEERDGFHAFLQRIEEDYPELIEYVDAFRAMADGP